MWRYASQECFQSRLCDVYPIRTFQRLYQRWSDFNSCALVDTLQYVVQSCSWKDWNFLGIHLFRCTRNLQGQHCSKLAVTRDDIADLSLRLGHHFSFRLLHLRHLPSFLSWKTSLFRGLAYALADSLLKLMWVCNAHNGGSWIWVELFCFFWGCPVTATGPG